jgi:hypothetical protein
LTDISVLGRFAETEGVAVLTLMVSRYKIELMDEPQFAHETLEQTRARLTATRLELGLTLVSRLKFGTSLMELQAFESATRVQTEMTAKAMGGDHIQVFAQPRQHEADHHDWFLGSLKPI